MSCTTHIMRLSQGDESISCIKLPKHSAALPANTLFIPVSWITLQTDTIPPQEVVRSSLQQLQPASVRLAAARSPRKKSGFC